MVTSRRISRSNSKRKRKGREAAWAAAFLLPSLAGVAIFTLIPSFRTAYTAFTSAMGAFSFPGNFTDALSNGAFQMATRNTIRFMGTCIPILVVLSLLLAHGLSGGVKQNSSLRACFLLPMAIPVSSIAFIWRLLLDNNGIINGILVSAGIAGRDWLNSSSAFWVLVVSYIWRNIGYDMVLFLAALSAIPPALYEAARIDGAGGFRLWIHITLPQLLPTLYTVTVLSLLNAFKVFREIYLLAGSYPDESIYMLQHLFNNWFSRMEMGKLSAAAMLMAAAVCLLIMALEKAWARERGD